LVKSYRAEGALTEALNMAVEGLALHSFDVELACEAGDLALSNGRMEEAEQYLKMALDIHSLHHGALKLLAGLYLHKENYDEVISLLEPIEDQEDRDAIFQWYLATAKRETEHFDAALTHYKEAYPAFSKDPV